MYKRQPFIYAAFRQAYGIDLFQEQGKLQWWEFVALLGALPSDTRLSNIIDIRIRPVPAPNGRNQEQISALLKLKAQYAIKNPVNKQSAKDGWERLWGILEKQAEAVSYTHLNRATMTEVVSSPLTLWTTKKRLVLRSASLQASS